MKRLTIVALRQRINPEKKGWSCWHFKMILILASWCHKIAFFKEYFNHDSFSNFFSPWIQRHSTCSTHYTMPRFLTWNPESSELKVWQNQVQVIPPQSTKTYSFGFRQVQEFLSEQYPWIGQSWPQALSWNFLILFDLWIPHFSLPDQRSFLAVKSLGSSLFELSQCLRRLKFKYIRLSPWMAALGVVLLRPHLFLIDFLFVWLLLFPALTYVAKAKYFMI